VAYIFKYIIGFVIGLIIAVFASLIAFKKGIEHRRKVAEEAIGSAEEEAKRIIIEAERQAEGKKREYLLMAKEEIHKSKLNLEKEVRERRNELARQERRLIQKEEAIDKKTIELEMSTCLGLEPSYPLMIPLASIWSIIRPALA
jgi:ribonuclease Y